MDQLKSFAIDLAYKAGETIKANCKLSATIDYKGGYSPVTEFDISINNMVIEAVHKYYPDHGVLAEELSSLSKNQDYIWVCDPIDGTIPFSHGIPISTFSLALVKNGNPILGVIYDPFMDRLFFAEKGSGATLNNQTIKVSDSINFQEDVIAFEAWSRAKFDLLPVITDLSNHDIKAMILCSIAYGNMMVACGEFVATIFPGIHAHDIAATKIIVEEAGGKVTDLFGKEQRYDQVINGAIVSNGVCHDKLLEFITNHLIKK